MHPNESNGACTVRRFVRTQQVRGGPLNNHLAGRPTTGSHRTPPGGRTTLLVDRVGGTEVRVQHLTVADDVPFRQHGKFALGKSGCLDVEFFVRFEILHERPEELVGDDATVVVRKPVLTSLVHVEAVVAPDAQFAVVVHLPVERPEAVSLTELADCLWIRYDRASRRRRSLQCGHVWTSRGRPRTLVRGDKPT